MDTPDEFRETKLKGKLVFQAECRLPKTLDDYRKEAVLTDCEVRVENKLFSVHKCIMAAATPMFQHVLLKQPTVRHMHLAQVSVVAFTLILEYIYTGCLDPQCRTVSECLQVLETAAFLGLSDVVTFGQSIIAENLTPATAVDLLNAATRLGMASAKFNVIKFMKENVAAMLERPDDLGRIHTDVLQEILQTGMTIPESATEVTLTMTQWLQQFHARRTDCSETASSIYLCEVRTPAGATCRWKQDCGQLFLILG